LLLQDAYKAHKPVLGVCYGLQSLNVQRAGSLVQHIESSINHTAGRAVAKAHSVTIEPDSRLAEILGDRKNGGGEFFSPPGGGQGGRGIARGGAIG
jgi:putative glutamine amidotransferase